MAARRPLLSVLGLALLALTQAALLGDSGHKVKDVNGLSVSSADLVLDNVKVSSGNELVAAVEAAASGNQTTPYDELAGFPIDDLDQDGLSQLVKVEEDIFTGEIDLHIAKAHYVESHAVVVGNGGRRKRIAPLIGRAAWTIGRALFNKFGRTHVTRSAGKVTQHYGARGNYQSAVRDFNRMRPTDVKSFTGKISGQTGRVGNYRVTVRDGSTGGGISRPTMSVHRGGGGSSLTRKFRYNQN